MFYFHSFKFAVQNNGAYLPEIQTQTPDKQERKTSKTYTQVRSQLRWFITFLSFCPTSQLSSWYFIPSPTCMIFFDRKSIVRVGRTGRFGGATGCHRFYFVPKIQAKGLRTLLYFIYNCIASNIIYKFWSKSWFSNFHHLASIPDIVSF